MVHIIPAVQYHRPNGEREEAGFYLPEEYNDRWDKIQEKIALLEKHGIELTCELMSPMVNVCLDWHDDSGQGFDYKFELYANNERLGHEVAELVLNFDEKDFLAKKEAHIKAELAAEHGS